jgi:hypothetical protein
MQRLILLLPLLLIGCRDDFRREPSLMEKNLAAAEAEAREAKFQAALITKRKRIDSYGIITVTNVNSERELTWVTGKTEDNRIINIEVYRTGHMYPSVGDKIRVAVNQNGNVVLVNSDAIVFEEGSTDYYYQKCKRFE